MLEQDNVGTLSDNVLKLFRDRRGRKIVREPEILELPVWNP